MGANFGWCTGENALGLNNESNRTTTKIQLKPDINVSHSYMRHPGSKSTTIRSRLFAVFMAPLARFMGQLKRHFLDPRLL